MPVDNDPSTLKTQNTAKPSGFHALLMWFTRKENLAVCAIAVIVLILHLLVIAKPCSMKNSTYRLPEIILTAAVL